MPPSHRKSGAHRNRKSSQGKGKPMKTLTRNTLLAVTLSASAGLAFAQSTAEHPTTPAPAPEKQAAAVESHLKVFDTLDFDVFSNQKWDRLHESHAKDIVVTWPDAQETKGIDRHIKALKARLVFPPTVSIKLAPLH